VKPLPRAAFTSDVWTYRHTVPLMKLKRNSLIINKRLYLETFDRVSSVVVGRFPLESDGAAVELVNGDVLGFTGRVCTHQHISSHHSYIHTIL